MAKGDIQISIDANASGAIRGFKQTESAAQRASRSINAGAKLAAGGFLTVGAGALVLAKGAADDQQAAVALATQLKNTTGATKAQVAATEAWISKQGQATGITDDQLRPALGRLATATGSVQKAQKLALLAQNVSIGTGKSYGTVVEALAKAQNGNIGALGRLGIATKDAHGKTKSLAAIQRDLAEKFKGQAAKQADTLGGKMTILKTQLSEAGESIGYALIPALTNLANFAVQKVLPAITAVGDWMSHNKPIVIAVGIAVGAFGAAFLVAAAAMKVYSAGATIVSAATKAWAAVQWVLNAAMSANPIALVVIAIAALVAGLIIAYKKSETFRNIVNGAFKAVGVAIGFVKDHWKVFLTAFLAGFGPVGIAIALLVTHFDTVKSVAKTVFKFIVNAFLTVVSALVNGAAKAFGWVPGIGPKLKAAAAKFDEFRDKVNAALDGIKSQKDIHLNVTTTQSVKLSSINKPRVPHGATGGIVTRPTLALIGEAGPEAVVPLNRTPGSSPLPAGAGGLNIEHLTIQAAPNEPINSSLPRALATLGMLYGAA